MNDFLDLIELQIGYVQFLRYLKIKIFDAVFKCWYSSI